MSHLSPRESRRFIPAVFVLVGAGLCACGAEQPAPAVANSPSPEPPAPSTLTAELIAANTSNVPAPAFPQGDPGFTAAPPLPEGVLDIPYPHIDDWDQEIQTQLSDGLLHVRGRLGDPAATDRELGTAYARLGMALLTYDLLEAAEVCFLNAETLTTNDFRWPYLLGHVYNRRGDLQKSLAQFQLALDRKDDYVPTLIHLGRARFDQTTFDSAAKLFARAAELDPQCAQAQIGLGKVAASRGDFPSAIEHLESARRIAPTATEINYPLGMAYRGNGNREKAQEFIAKRGGVPAAIGDELMYAVHQLALGRQSYQTKANALMRDGLFEEAVTEYRKAVDSDPSDPANHNNLGMALAKMGDQPGARAAFDAALVQDSADVTAHYNLGTLEASQGHDAKAAGHYRAAIESNPGMLRARFNLANALRRSEQYEASLEHYRAAIEGDPGMSPARLGEVFSLIRLERYADARLRLEEGHESVPEDREIVNTLVRLLAATPQDDLRDAGKALALGESLAATQVSVYHLVTLAMVAAEIGRYEQAAQMQRSAIEVYRQADQTAVVADLQKTLERYERDEPCRDPWPPSDPLLSPTR